MNLRARQLVPEKMDAPDLDPQLHRHALSGLRRIHRFSRTAIPIAETLVRLARTHQLDRVRICDLGCGGGDLSAEVAIRVSRSLPCQLSGWDRSPFAVRQASQHREHVSTASRGRAVLSLETVDALADDFSSQAACPTFDFVYCSLFLHHFETSEAVEILRRMQSLARYAVVVDDLQRSRLGYAIAWIGCRLLSRSPIVHFDGPQSVIAAFTADEALTLAHETGWGSATIFHHWPARYQLVMERAP